ncbi:response regulator transcription factor [candidate division CSSED10-310 bacterium]|uniref:Response regulator transcription factor n=1 Tax=candidate division CSSED10-310 bacterium TaxID=2855610 RepID=A0ABV6YWU6_UNCC1
MPGKRSYLITCWNCMGDYDFESVGWCSCTNKGPTKVCPFCYKCFCDLSQERQNEIWEMAPPEYLTERDSLLTNRKAKKKSAQEQIFDMFELPKETYKVLVVEDDLSLQQFLKKLLESYFLIPICVSDGKAALQKIKDTKIHLVLLDLMIPGLNGFQVCRHLKDDVQTKDLPVIIVTARGNVIDKVKGFVLGVDDYLTKPFQGTELVIRILNLIRKNYLL